MMGIEEFLEWIRDPSDAEGRGSPRSGIGVLTPLLEKWHGSYQGAPVGDSVLVLTAAAQTLPKNPDANSATVQVQGAAIRYNFGSTGVSTATSLRADIGTILVVETVQALWGFQAVNEGAGVATLAIAFWS
jgi:hypothetical protein